MERIGSIAARVLADLRAANDNGKGAGFDSATSPAKAKQQGPTLARVEKGAGASARPSPRLEVAGRGSNPSGKGYPVGNADIAAAPSREDGCRVRHATLPARVGGGSGPPRVEEMAGAEASGSDRRGCGGGNGDGGR